MGLMPVLILARGMERPRLEIISMKSRHTQGASDRSCIRKPNALKGMKLRITCP